jgi:hypothetical protein
VVNYITTAGSPKSLTSPSTVLTIDEPNLTAKPAGAATDSTRVVTVTHTANSGADAYIPTLTVTLTNPPPFGFTATCNPACSGGTVGIVGGTITAKWPMLALGPNNTLSLVIQGQGFGISLPVGQVNATVAWQSLSDTAVSSAFNVAAHARSHPGVASADGGVIDDYTFTSSAH